MPPSGIILRVSEVRDTLLFAGTDLLPDGVAAETGVVTGVTAVTDASGTRLAPGCLFPCGEVAAAFCTDAAGAGLVPGCLLPCGTVDTGFSTMTASLHSGFGDGRFLRRRDLFCPSAETVPALEGVFLPVSPVPAALPGPCSFFVILFPPAGPACHATRLRLRSCHYLYFFQTAI